jgi:hypothetical protein
MRSVSVSVTGALFLLLAAFIITHLFLVKSIANKGKAKINQLLKNKRLQLLHYLFYICACLIQLGKLYCPFIRVMRLIFLSTVKVFIGYSW